MKKKYVSSAYVVHIRAYRNTSALIDFFTQTHGVIRAVANGMFGNRKQQLHWKGLLRPLQSMQISWGGETALKTLVDVEGERRVGPLLQGQYLYCGFYLNELVLRCLPEQEGDAALFTAYERCALALSQRDDMQISLRTFEISLLHALGYGIDFSCDIHGAAITCENFYQFDPRHGFFLQSQDTQYAISGKCLLALAAGDFLVPKAKATAKYILREALRPHLGSKPIFSRHLFTDL